MKERRTEYLQAMGITPWLLRTPPTAQNRPGSEIAEATGAKPLPDAPQADLESGCGSLPVADRPWQQLEEQVASCQRCVLHETRIQTVFGVGSTEADWLIIGEAPGADEDRQGQPFVGRAGQLLNAMLKAVGLRRADVYIANILKCRPPGNRDPLDQEVLCCEPYLARQIALIQPKLILALGRVAAQNLLKVETPVGRLRGRVHEYGDGSIPLVVTYHPAYLLRSPEQKAKAWQDLKLARGLVS